jgi:MFS family permease
MRLLPSAFIGSWVSKRMGRRPAMILAGAFFLVGAVLLAAAFHVAMLILGRVIMGLGVHCANAACWLKKPCLSRALLSCACILHCALREHMWKMYSYMPMMVGVRPGLSLLFLPTLTATCLSVPAARRAVTACTTECTPQEAAASDLPPPCAL